MNKLMYILVAGFMLNSCGGNTTTNGSSVVNNSCSSNSQKAFVYSFMSDNYLWNESMNSVDRDNYGSAEELLDAMKVDLDRWSFIVDKKVIEDYFNKGEYIGYGVKISRLEDSLYISMVYSDSPAAISGIKRGAEILKINGVSVQEISDRELNDLLGKDVVGVECKFELMQDGEIKEIVVKKDKIKANSVITTKILIQDNIKIGYIVFDKFVAFSKDELDKAFDKFKQEGVSKLIVDLRYNGGGLVDVSQYLASLITAYQSGYYIKLKYNSNNSYKNSEYYFKKLGNTLNLDEVNFITTNHTCSASEAVINGLKPYIDVKVFGENSCGKPVGMEPKEFCGKYIFAINFRLENVNGVGNYFDGLSTNCQAQDDLTHDFGDVNEGMLKSVLYYIKNGTCKSTLGNRLNRVTKVKSNNILYGVHNLTGAF